MSSVLATRDQPGPSARSVRAPPGAKAERIRPGGGGELTYSRAAASALRTPGCCPEPVDPAELPASAVAAPSRSAAPRGCRTPSRRRSVRATRPTGELSRPPRAAAAERPRPRCPAESADRGPHRRDRATGRAARGPRARRPRARAATPATRTPPSGRRGRGRTPSRSPTRRWRRPPARRPRRRRSNGRPRCPGRARGRTPRRTARGRARHTRPRSRRPARWGTARGSAAPRSAQTARRHRRPCRPSLPQHPPSFQIRSLEPSAHLNYSVTLSSRP